MGNNAYVAGTSTDLDGGPRILDGDGDGTATVDMGAYERIILSTLVGTATLQGRTDHTGDLSIRFYATNNVTPTYTFTPTMSANGTFTITSAASGTYTVAVKHAQSLQVVQVVTLTASATTSHNFGELKMSDANGDNVVNILDLSLLSGAYGTVTGDAAYNPAADFNGDGFVNILDLSLLSGNYGKVGEEP